MSSVVQMPDRSTARSRVASEVRAELARAQVSGNRLAALLGQSQPYWSRRLTGKVAFDVDDLTAIADLLGISVTAFFGVPTQNPRPTVSDGGVLPGHPVGCRCDGCARRDSNPQPSDP